MLFDDLGWDEVVLEGVGFRSFGFSEDVTSEQISKCENQSPMSRCGRTFQAEGEFCFLPACSFLLIFLTQVLV